MTSVEHRVPRSVDPAQAGEYENCLYVCRWCNRARGSEPIEDERSGARLLDPTVDVWADHFTAVDDRLEPREGDAGAVRTHAVYEIDDARKVARRRARRELIEDRFALRDAILPELGKLLDAAESALETNRQTFLELIAAIQEVRRLARRIFRDLDKLAACPIDAPEACRCGDRENHSLPRGIEEGLIDWFESELAREREP